MRQLQFTQFFFDFISISFFSLVLFTFRCYCNIVVVAFDSNRINFTHFDFHPNNINKKNHQSESCLRCPNVRDIELHSYLLYTQLYMAFCCCTCPFSHRIGITLKQLCKTVSGDESGVSFFLWFASYTPSSSCYLLRHIYLSLIIDFHLLDLRM